MFMNNNTTSSLWTMVIHIEEAADWSRFMTIFETKDLPGKDMWPRESSFVWCYDKNTEEEKAEKMVEELSRDMGEVELMVYRFDSSGSPYHIEEYAWACNGEIEWQHTDTGFLHMIDWLNCCDIKNLFTIEDIIFDSEYVFKRLCTKAREGHENCQGALIDVLFWSDYFKHTFSDLKPEDEQWLCQWVNDKSNAKAAILLIVGMETRYRVWEEESTDNDTGEQITIIHADKIEGETLFHRNNVELQRLLDWLCQHWQQIDSAEKDIIRKIIKNYTTQDVLKYSLEE